MKNLSLVMLCLLLLCSCKADLPQEGSSPSSADEESLPAASAEESYEEDIDCELYENPPFRAASL
ncbi:MAG: hypothetical protein J6W31_01770, partial [Clostridia bacterium]|nr:hypothetical protein [Clostridia bacterium]